MTDDQLYAASKLWRQGLLIKDLAERIRITEYAFKACMARNRDLFPRRHHTKGRIFIPKVADPVPPKPEYHDRMRFTTSTGYVCTMPRISILEAR